ncbi:MAG: hypothetical protein JWM73_2303, partial [Solirubrobacterales bacterium]|nr:hypothetical protein [Solirubrobacterales bacterium]
MGEARSSSSSAGARAAIKLGLALLLVAGVFDAEPLYVGGVAFLVLGIGCIAWVASGARGVHVGRTLVAPRVVEDEPLAVDIELHSSRVALPSCLVVDPLLAEPVAVRGGRRTATLSVEARFPRRGRHRLAPPTVVVRDPLGLAQRAIAGQRIDEVLVLPRVEPVRAAGSGSGQRGTVTRRARPGIAPAAEVDIDGLRPSREGAPASRIHWPAFARTGELLERKLRPEGDTRPLVLLDPRGEDPALLDAAVRAAASLCVHLAEVGGCALLLPGERRPAPLEPGLSGWPHLHARLAMVEGGGAPSLSGLASRRGAIFYVAARALGRVPPVLAHAPAAGRILVVPGVLAGRRPAFSVAGCTGYDLAPVRR